MGGDRIQSRVLLPATVVRTLHIGPYEALGEAYTALNDWITDEGLESAGPMLERYLNGPGESVSPNQYRTEIEMPVATRAVAATAL
jgi:effector-binding domain-containing protein